MSRRKNKHNHRKLGDVGYLFLDPRIPPRLNASLRRPGAQRSPLSVLSSLGAFLKFAQNITVIRPWMYLSLLFSLSPPSTLSSWSPVLGVPAQLALTNANVKNKVREKRHKNAKWYPNKHRERERERERAGRAKVECQDPLWKIRPCPSKRAIRRVGMISRIPSRPTREAGSCPTWSGPSRTRRNRPC